MVKKLPFSKQIYYAIGQWGWSTVINIIGINLVYFYLPPSEAGLPHLITQDKFFYVLNAIALLAAGGRFIEAFTDPIIAGMSDKSTNPKGRRLPFMLWGALPAALACFLIFFPPHDTISFTNILWIAGFQLMFYVGFGLYVMPHNALLIELGHNDKERLNISTIISVTYALGIITASMVPALGEVLQKNLGISKAEGFQYAIGIISLFAFFCMLLPVLTINEKEYCQSQPSTLPIWDSLKATMKNKQFQQFVFSDCAYWTGLAVIETGLVYYVTVLIGEQESYVTTVFVFMLLFSFAFYPLVNFLAKRMAKKILIQASFLLMAISFGIVYFLGNLPISETVQLIFVSAFAGIAAAFLGILPNTVLANISELDALKTGVNKEGMFFAARTIFMKLGATLGVILFATLLTFGKEKGHDLGIRISGIAGVFLCLIAFLIFQNYKEKEVLAEIQRLKNEK